jgi:hypothetical protein
MVEKITREKALSLSEMIVPMKMKVLSAGEGAEFYIYTEEKLFSQYYVMGIFFLGNLWISDESYRKIFEEFIEKQ